MVDRIQLKRGDAVVDEISFEGEPVRTVKRKVNFFTGDTNSSDAVRISFRNEVTETGVDSLSDFTSPHFEIDREQVTIPASFMTRRDVLHSLRVLENDEGIVWSYER